MTVPVPGFRGADGKEKGKGVTARWGLEEAQSKDAGRRTGTGYEVCTPGTSGHVTAKSSIRTWGVLYKSGAYAWKVVRLTLGDLHGVPGFSPGDAERIARKPP